MRAALARRLDAVRLRLLPLALAIGLLALPVPASALVGSTPVGSFEIGGLPATMVHASGGQTFVGGRFTRAGTPTPHGVQVDPSAGAAASPALPTPDGNVNAVVPDGSGGWYIAGLFTHVGAVAVDNLAHLVKSGSTYAVDTTFLPNPGAAAGNGTVSALALSPDRKVLYVGGFFTQLGVGGASPTSVGRLVALNTSGGGLICDYALNGAVSALVVAPGSAATNPGGLYAGGSFTGVLGASSGTNGIAAFAAPPAGGGCPAAAAGSSAYNVNGAVGALAISPDGGTLYAGGGFQEVNGSSTVNANHIASFSTASGLALTDSPTYSANSNVNALALSTDGGTLYAGGSFTSVNTTSGGTQSQAIAAFDTTTGVETANSPNYGITSAKGGNASVNALAVSGSTLYAGGLFDTVDNGGSGTPVARNNVASFDATGNATSFDPNVDAGVTAIGIAAGGPGGQLYLGGAFNYVGAATVFNNLLEVNADGTLNTAFNPNVNGPVQSLALAPNGSTLYAGGTFTAVNGGFAGGPVTVANLAAFTTTGVGAATTFHPKLTVQNATVSIPALAISPSGSLLYVVGSYDRVNGASPQCGNVGCGSPIAFNTADGTIDQAFVPITPGGFSVPAALALGPSELYVAGIGGVVAVDPTSGAADTTFQPDFNGNASGQASRASGLALLLSGSTLYVGGQFANVNGTTPANGVAAVDATTGADISSFDPQLGPPASCNMGPPVQCVYRAEVLAFALSPDGSTLYLGGAFETLAGAPQSGLAAVDPTTGALQPAFHPVLAAANGTAGSVMALAAFGTNLYAAGGFATVNGVPQAGFAEFAGPPPAPSVVTGPASAVTASGASVAGVVNPNGTATTYVFEYGPSLSFGSVTARTSAGSGAADVPVSAVLSGLSPRTTYFYRLVAKTSAGETFGTVMSFVTGGSPAAPVVVTGPPSAVGSTTATMAGQVNPEGQLTAFTFEYGPTLSFGTISTVDQTDAAGTLESVGAALSGLSPDTTYFYRLVATNPTGTTFGSVSSFTTGPGGLPAVTTGAASGVTSTGATLAGTVDPHGKQTTFAFEYGTSTSFGSLSAVDNAGSTEGVEAVSLPIAGLQTGTIYFYRLVATNTAGTTVGVVRSFTTL